MKSYSKDIVNESKTTRKFNYYLLYFNTALTLLNTAFMIWFFWSVLDVFGSIGSL